MDAIEGILRALWPHGTAVVLLNFARWCRTLDGGAMQTSNSRGHRACQRLLFNRSHGRASVARVPAPEPWAARLARVAAHYGATAVSLFEALRPLVESGELPLSDFTHDGIHGIVWPRGTTRGAVYATFVGDALAGAVDTTLLEYSATAWTPNRRAWRAAAPHHPLRPQSREQQWQKARGAELPQALSRGAESSLLGVRCYGSLGRQSVGRWVKVASGGIKQCKTAGPAHSQNFQCFHQVLDSAGRKRNVGGATVTSGLPPGWAQTDHECGYDRTLRGWVPALARGTFKPGLTSVHPNDTVSLVVDSTAGGGAAGTATAMLQLTYLQSYDECGVLRVECVAGCVCTAATIDTLLPGAKYAALNRSAVRVSQASRCEVRLINVGRPAGGGGLCPTADSPCTKVKLVGLSVLREPGHRGIYR